MTNSSYASILQFIKENETALKVGHLRSASGQRTLGFSPVGTCKMTKEFSSGCKFDCDVSSWGVVQLIGCSVAKWYKSVHP